jgi:hypothetical protein
LLSLIFRTVIHTEGEGAYRDPSCPSVSVHPRILSTAPDPGLCFIRFFVGVDDLQELWKYPEEKLMVESLGCSWGRG